MPIVKSWTFKKNWYKRKSNWFSPIGYEIIETESIPQDSIPYSEIRTIDGGWHSYTYLTIDPTGLITAYRR